jgi:hypothetical protein
METPPSAPLHIPYPHPPRPHFRPWPALLLGLYLLLAPAHLPAADPPARKPATRCRPLPETARGEATYGLASGTGTVEIWTEGDETSRRRVEVTILGDVRWNLREVERAMRAEIRSILQRDAQCDEPDIELEEYGTYSDPVARGKGEFPLSIPDAAREALITDVPVEGTVVQWSDDGEPEEIEWDWQAACPLAVRMAIDEAERDLRITIERSSLRAEVRGQDATGKTDLRLETPSLQLELSRSGVRISGRVRWDWDEACRSATSAGQTPKD